MARRSPPAVASYVPPIARAGRGLWPPGRVLRTLLGPATRLLAHATRGKLERAPEGDEGVGPKGSVPLQCQ